MSYTRRAPSDMQALRFDGVDDRAVMDSSVGDACPYTGYTYAAVVRIPAGATGGSYDGYIIGSNYQPGMTVQLSSGRVTYWTREPDGSNNHLVVGTSDLRDGEIHAVLLTVEPDDGVDIRNGVTCRAWVDGVLDGTASLVGLLPSLQTSINRVGAFLGPDGLFEGDIASVGVWSRVLTIAEMADLYLRPTTASVIADAAEFFDMQTLDVSGDPVGVNGTVLELTGTSVVPRASLPNEHIVSRGPTT